MTDSLFDVEELNEGPSTDAADATAVDVPAGRQSLSLYRKYRPQSFATDELFGQDHIVNTLKNAIRLDRVAHAYLFCGPRGTGKTTTARILAKAVNCLDPEPNNRPCNQCDACRAINANATTDVIEIDAASNRGIDDIRELRERAKYAPSNLQTKFYIIDEAHQITGAAANAFLKTLEEPPPHTKFVLATTDPEELLQTIVSRCQRFDFRRISIDAMSARLEQVAELEGISIDDESITTIARHATGSLRDALGLLDQVAVYPESADGEDAAVTNDLVRTVLGVSRNDRVEGLVRSIADHDAGAGLTIINDAVEAGEDIRQLGRQLISYLRVLMLERASGSPDADDVARELATRFDLPALARVATIFADIDYKARHATIVQLPMELALIDACTPPSATTSATQPQPSNQQSQEAPAPSGAPTPPARPRKGPSLKDRVRGASMPRESSTPSSQPPSQTPTAREQSTEQQPREEAAPRHVSEPPPGPQETEYAERPAAQGGGSSADLDLVVERWNNIRMDVKALNRRTEALLQQADPLMVEGSQLTLVAAYPFHQKKLNDDETRRIIEEVVERQIGKKLSIICVSRDEAQGVRSQASPAAASNPAPSVPAQRPPADRETTRESSPSSTQTPDDDDSEPSQGAPPPMRPPDPDDDLVAADIEATPSSVSSLDLDEERIKAAINIFDAVIIDEE